MNTTSLEQANDESARWLRFLSRWALAMVLTALALLAVFLGGIGFAPSDDALGTTYSEFLQAARSPVMHRVFTALDGLGWVMMGGALLVLAVVLKDRAPVRALLIAACGIGMFTGVLRALMRLVGVSDLAAQYAGATPAQRTALLQPMLVLYEIIRAHFVAGDVLAGAGWLLVTSVGFAFAGFPRWLTGWFALAGVLSLLQARRARWVRSRFPCCC